MSGLVRHRGEEPSHDLPIASNPPVLTPCVSFVLRRIVIDNLNIGDQPGSHIRPFNQVMREQGVAWEAPLQHLVQNADVVDSLARKDAFAKEILVHVRDRTRIDVEAGLAGVDGRQPGSRGRGDADADARLQDAVTGRDDPSLRTDDGTVERMRHRADQPRSSGPWEFCVGVERDDKTHIM